jgi:hypothetical protein
MPWRYVAVLEIRQMTSDWKILVVFKSRCDLAWPFLPALLWIECGEIACLLNDCPEKVFVFYFAFDQLLQHTVAFNSDISRRIACSWGNEALYYVV